MVGIKKSEQRAMIEERRLEVARLYYRGNVNATDIANIIIPKWNVDLRTVQKDVKYIKDHESQILQDYMSKTLPHIMTKTLFRLEMANKEAFNIVDKSEITEKDRIRLAALGIIDRIARNMFDIVTNNKPVIDKIREVDDEQQQYWKQQLSEQGTDRGRGEAEAESRDENAVF